MHPITMFELKKIAFFDILRFATTSMKLYFIQNHERSPTQRKKKKYDDRCVSTVTTSQNLKDKENIELISTYHCIT